MKSLYFFIPLLFLSLISCQNQPAPEAPSEAKSVSLPDDPFADYWYQGKAEITSYKLEQARYGQVHPGYAVLIFVTEDFSKSKQVKLDYPGKNPNDKVNVLKLNHIRKFNTGMYQYSLMQSTFTPVDYKGYPNTLKSNISVQDWCGHVFTQLNYRKNSYQMTSLSYFGSEGDQEKPVGDAILEDELFNRLRINPATLPQGEVEMIPGLFYSRLRHQEVEPVKAELSLEKGEQYSTYTISYPTVKRTLTIKFATQFPHEIESWEETYPSGFGPGAEMLTTKAVRNKSLFTDYWTKNQLEDANLRAKLDI